jgi:myo-inositol-1(or 4)-monophosphatase
MTTTDEAPPPPSPTLVDELAELARAMADEVGQLLRAEVLRADIVVTNKSSPSDWVTEVDERVEALLVERIGAARPADGILGEEGTSRPSESGVRWILDPIDGTTNFMHALPGFGCSIAAEIDGIVEVGVVIDPMHGLRYEARRGHGATCNGEPIGVRAVDRLASAVIATGFSYDAERRRQQVAAIAVILGEIGDIRRLGAASTDLCAVAAGKLAGYFEHGLNVWDYAAGALIAAEAGAIVRVPEPGDDHDLVYALAPGIATEFVALLDRSGATAITRRSPTG